MSSFPWESLKAETLRSICKDLGANSVMKRKQDMATFLKEVEIRGLSSTSQDCKPTGKASNDPVPDPVTKGCEEPDSEDSDTDDMDIMDCSSNACTCGDGLSPRMKFILSTVAAVASDLVRDTGEFAGEFGHVGGVYMAHHIPVEEHPRGKKAAALWVDGLSTIYGVIYKMFKAGRIPTEPALLEALEKLPKSDQILVRAYTKHTEIEHALSGLVLQAKEDWEGEFQETHCGGKGWRKLPVCAKHDLDWGLAEDVLVG